MPRFHSLSVVAAACILAALPMTAACSRAEKSSEGGGTEQAGESGERVQADGTLSSPLRDFVKVDVAGPDDVEIAVGPDFAVSARGPQAVLDRLEFSREGDALKISRKRGFAAVHGDAHIRVAMPRLAGASLTGSGDLSIDRLAGDDAALSLTGSGDVTVRELAVGRLDVALTGSGDVGLAGTARSAKFSVTGSGGIDGERLTVGAAEISLLGSGDVDFASDGEVKAGIMGSGDVKVTGKARCAKSGMGSGTLRCG